MVEGGILLLGMILTWVFIRFYPKRNTGELQEDTKELHVLFGRTQRLLKEEQYFLNKNLKLSDLALALACSERDLSRAINLFGQSNFNRFINSLRIEYSKGILLNPKFYHYTIEAIAEDCGFSNKVSFYNSFKAETGMSPAQFRALEQSRESKP